MSAETSGGAYTLCEIRSRSYPHPRGICRDQERRFQATCVDSGVKRTGAWTMTPC